MIWNLQGTEQQNALVRQALAACDFPFDELAPSLAREGKTGIDVTWEDLSQRGARATASQEHDEGMHTIVREVDGRARVLGLFYLPPYTRVVVDSSLVSYPVVAQEVLLAEGAHAVDYHWMLERGLRRAVWNALHADTEDTTATVPETGDVGHGDSWFEGSGGYSTWVGESWMALFVRAYAPTIPVTINLSHPVTDAAAAEVRRAFAEYLPAVGPAVYRGKTRVFHDEHKRIKPVEWYGNAGLARAAGLRPCGVCKPGS